MSIREELIQNIEYLKSIAANLEELAERYERELEDVRELGRREAEKEIKEKE